LLEAKNRCNQKNVLKLIVSSRIEKFSQVLAWKGLALQINKNVCNGEVKALGPFLHLTKKEPIS